MARILLAFALFCSTFAASAPDPAYYVRKASWHETMRTSRETLAMLRDKSKNEQLTLFSPWKCIGPFRATASKPFDEIFPPERSISPDSTYAGLRWTDRPEWQDGQVTSLGSDTMCAHYLFRTISASRDTTLTLSLGSDDGINVWMNDRKVLSHGVDRGAEPDQEGLTVALHAGRNELLIKINNHFGPSGFYFGVDDADLRLLRKLVNRDFPDPASTREIEWELADSIWSSDWTPGDVASLATRYAGRAMCETPGEFTALAAKARTAGTPADLEGIRAAYLATKAAQLVPVILTPEPPAAPRINGPRRVGARPGNPFLFTVPISGDRPISVHASGLPRGLTIDPASGIITGQTDSPGTNRVTITAANRHGKATGTLAIVIGPTIALTPPLGWNSWNCFASAVDDKRVRSAADAMVASGLSRHGWSYVNIDDCWEIKPGSTDPMLSGDPRSSAGMINTNKKFPDMHALGEYIHGKGLKMGIYSSPGPLTCAGFTASYGHEPDDARQYAAWGIDYLKYDWCSYGRIAKDRNLPELQKPYLVMRAALDSMKRDIVYSLCQYGMGNVWEWGATVGGNCWRTTGDIEDTWESMSGIGFAQTGKEAFAGPGRWNDPDMLVVGKVGWGPALHPTRLTPNEQYTHISLWCLLASPLLIGCDMTQMDDFTLSLLTNDEVLAVNQDPLGNQAGRVSQNGALEVWAKTMEDGSFAVGLFNRGRWKENVTVTWAELGLKGPHAVRDLWRQKDLGTFDGEFSAPVPRHGVVLVSVK